MRAWLTPLVAVVAAVPLFSIGKGLLSVLMGGVVGGGVAAEQFERYGMREAFDRVARLPSHTPVRATVETWHKKSEKQEVLLDIVSKTVLTAGAFAIGIGFAPALQTATVLAVGYGVSLAGIGLYVQRHHQAGVLKGIETALTLAQEFSPAEKPVSDIFAPQAPHENSFNAKAVRPDYPLRNNPASQRPPPDNSGPGQRP